MGAPMSRRRGTAKADGDPPIGWKERVAALRHVPALFRLIWETHRGYAVSMVLLRIVSSVIPVSTFWVGKLILDSVIAARAGNASLTQV